MSNDIPKRGTYLDNPLIDLKPREDFLTKEDSWQKIRCSNYNVCLFLCLKTELHPKKIHMDSDPQFHPKIAKALQFTFFIGLFLSLAGKVLIWPPIFCCPKPHLPVLVHSPSFWLPAAPILCWVNRFWLYRVGSAAAAYCWIPEYAWVRASIVLPVPLVRPLLPRPPFNAAIPLLEEEQG